MSDLHWERFASLTGDPRNNWEVLCREVVRRHYERFGPLATRKQNPGVEFHVKVEAGDCDLGGPGCHWGWQCKWFNDQTLKRDGSLLAAQRTAIEDSIEKTVRHVPGLTDWVLWTREKFTAADARWLADLDAPFTLHHWDGETLIGLLTGPAEALRQSWFGSLTLSREELTRRRCTAMAPIAHRYVEELHILTSTQRDVEARLMEPLPEDELSSILVELEATYEGLQETLHLAKEQMEQMHLDLMQALGTATESLGELRDRLSEGLKPSREELERADALTESPRDDELWGDHELDFEYADDASRRQEEGLLALRRVRRFLKIAALSFGRPMIVASGSAGAGKTHLSANITGPSAKAQGVLLLGSQFSSGIEDDDLARHSGLAGTLDELLEAMEAMGVREGRRVPLVIDGINESEDPSDWKGVLARLQSRLTQLGHVFALITVRPSYRRFCLPDDVPTVDLAGLVGVEREAVDRYFSHYRIDATPAAIDWWQPTDPLLLSVFCRTVNPEATRTIDADDLPGSLSEVFDAYLDGVVARIATTMEVPEVEIMDAVLLLGERFYDAQARQLGRLDVTTVLGDQRRAKWKESLRFQLESEEIVLREVVEEGEYVIWAYDLLAGHVIGKGLLQRFDVQDLTAATSSALEAHPLVDDIITGMAGILGRRQIELAEVFSENQELYWRASLASLRLPPEQMGEASLEGLRLAFPRRSEVILDAISGSLLRPNHPLNALILDRILGGLDVWERDLTWSGSGAVGHQIARLSETWRLGESSGADAVAMAWLSWTLTTPYTHRRDEAVLALYRLGLREPGLLFRRVIEMLNVNDPAILEGLLGAAYGVAMRAQDPLLTDPGTVTELARDLQDRLLCPAASDPTLNWQIREYAYRITQFASWLSEGELVASGDAAQPPLPQPKSSPNPALPDSGAWEEVDAAVEIEEVGEAIKALSLSAADGREQEIEGLVRARIAELGWARLLAAAEENETDPDRLNSYAEKYARAGILDAAGRLSDEGCLLVDPGSDAAWRLPEPRLDPSFPESAPVPRFLSPWRNESDPGQKWIQPGPSQILNDLLQREDEDGSWLLTDARLAFRLSTEPYVGASRIRGLLALEGWESIEDQIAAHGIDNDAVPEIHSEHDCYGGEIPWAPSFDSQTTKPSGESTPRLANFGGAPGPPIELLGIGIAWPLRRSAFNTAEIGAVPAKFLCRSLQLRQAGSSMEFIDEHERPAARAFSCRGFQGWSGSLLYLRRDLLERYANERDGEWGWVLDERREITSNRRDRQATGKNKVRDSHTVSLASLS